jgi:YVTN family beta-propeller protein
MKFRILATFLSIIFLSSIVSPVALAATISGNLSSTRQVDAATAAGTIHVGTHNVAIQSGQLITPAEAVALSQIISTGHQSLILGAAGNAVGGSVNITGQSLSSLVIPTGVKVLDNVAGSSLTLTGGLINSGSLFLYSTSSGASTASLTAADIINEKGGLLSSVVPASLLAGLTSIPALSLNLSALNNLINAGIISSSGGINLTAGNSITNSGSIISGSVGNINLTSNIINNSSLINSVAGNININAANAGNISVNNVNGTLQALLGNINVRDASFTANANFDLTGGNVLSKVLNINSGSGVVNVDANTLSGLVNVNAGSAHVTAATQDLLLGTMNLTGDPTFFNTDGNVTIDSPLMFAGMPLAVVASGNILLGAGATEIDTGSTTTAGGAITLIAGADIQPLTPSGSSTTAGGAGTTNIQVTGASKTGGEIDLVSGGTPLTGINSLSTVGSGGAVTLIAFKGTTTGSGDIVLGSPIVTNSLGQTIVAPTAVDITTTGAVGSPSGNVTIIGGGTTAATVRVPDLAAGGSLVNLNTGSSILLGNINASSGASTGGNVTIASAQPVIIGGTLSISSTGAIMPSSSQTSGIFQTSGLTLASGNITQAGTQVPVGGILGVAADGGISVQTNGSISVQSLTSNGLVSLVNSSGTVVPSTDGINLQAGGSIGINGSLQANASTVSTGNITLNATSGNIIYGGNIVSSNGNVTMKAGGSIEGLNQTTATISASTSIEGANGFQFLLGAVVDNANGMIYVPDTHNNTISVISMATNQQVANVTLGSGVTLPQGVTSIFDAPEGMTLGSNGMLYVANSGNGTISVINPATNTVTQVISSPSSNPGLLQRVEALALSPNGQTLYVINNSFSATSTTAAQAGLVMITNLSSTTPTVTTIPLPNGATAMSQTGGVVVNPQGTLLFVSASGTKQVFIYSLNPASPASLPKLIQTVSLASVGKEAPIFLAMNPDGTQVYVSEAFTNEEMKGVTTATLLTEGSIAVINAVASSSTFGKLIAVDSLPHSSADPKEGSFPQGLAVNATGTEVISQATFLPFAFSTYTGINQTIEFIPVGNGPDGFGSNQFSTIVNTTTSNGVSVPVQTTFTSNTLNLQAIGTPGTFPVQPNTISVVSKPTIQSGVGQAISLTTTSGDILADVNPNGGTLSLNTGSGAVMVNDVGSNAAGTTVLASSAAKNFFEIGSLETLHITGAINSPDLILQTTGAANINIGSTIGQATGTVTLTTGTGNITESAGGSVVAKSLTITSLGGSVSTNTTSTLTGTSGMVPNPTTLPGSGLGTTQLISVTDNGTTLVNGTNFTFDSATGTITWLTGVNVGDNVQITTPFQTTTSTLSANTSTTATGSIFIQNTGALTVTGSSAGNTFQLTNSAPVTIAPGTGAPAMTGIVAPNVSIQSVGNISIGGQLGTANNPNNSISLNTGGVGSITNTAGSFIISGGSLTLFAGSGGIGTAAAPLRTNVSALDSATAEGTATTGIFIKNTGGIALGNVTTTGTFSLTTTGTGDITNLSGAMIAAQTLTLQTAGSIGATGALQTSASSLTVQAGTQAGDSSVSIVFAPIDDAGANVITINKSSAGGTFNVSTSVSADDGDGTEASIKVAGAITAPNVVLETGTGSNGSITLGANIGEAGTGSTTISTDSVVNAAGAVGNAIVHTAGSILSSAVTLSTLFGNIGSSSAPIALGSSSGATTSLTVTAGDTPPVVTTGSTTQTATGSSSAFIKATGNLDLLADSTGNIGSASEPLNISSSTGNFNLSAPAGSAFLNVTSGKVDLTGASTVLNTLSINNSAGALAVGGTGTLDPTGTLSTELDLGAKTNLTVTNGSVAGVTPETIQLTAGGAISWPTNTITVSSGSNPNGDGGTISVTAKSIAFTGTGPLTISANANDASGNGGNITFAVSGTQAFSISSTAVIAKTTQLVFNAMAGSSGNESGNITINAGGAITVDSSGVNNQVSAGNMDGGNLSIMAGGKLTGTSSFSTAGNSGGTGGNLTLKSGNALSIAGSIDAGTGDVTLSANGPTAFQIGGANPTNGVGQTVTGADIKVTNASGISLNNALGGLTGSVEFDTTKFTNNTDGSISGAQSLTINSGTGSLAIATVGTANWGAPSSVTLLSGGALSTGTLFATTLTSGVSNIDIDAKGALTFDFSSMSAVTTTGGPGSITIVGSTVSFSNNAALHTFTASGADADGSVSFTLTGTKALAVGSAPGDISIDIASGDGANTTTGGSILVSNGGTLTVDPTQLQTSSQVASANNVFTNLTLKSGGNLQIGTGMGIPTIQQVVGTPTPTAPGTGPNLEFASHSSTAFTIGTGAQANGIPVGMGQTLSAASLTIINSLGSVGSATTPITVNAVGLSLQAGTSVNAVDMASSIAIGSGLFQTGASVSTVNTTGSVAIGSSSAGTSFTLSAPTATEISIGSSSAGKSFTLDATNAVVQNATGLISTPSLTLNVANMTTGATVGTNATTISGISTAAGSSWNVVDSSTKTVMLKSVTSGTGPTDGVVSFSTDGALAVAGTISAGTISIQSVGNISIGALGQIGTSTESGNSVTLNTGGVGTITNANGTAPTIVTDSLSLLAGASGAGIGTAAAPLRTNVNSLDQVITGGQFGTTSAFINNVGAIDIGGATGTGAGVILPGTFSLVAGGTIMVNSVIQQASVVNLTANNSGNIVVNASFGASSNTLVSTGSKDTLIAAGSITDDGGFNVRGASLVITAGGSIGTSAAPIQTSAGSLTANAGSGSTDNVFINGSNDMEFPQYVLAINKSSAGGTFSVTTSTNVPPPATEGNISDIEVLGAISAPSVNLSTNTGMNGTGTDTNGAILILANVGTANSTTSISTQDTGFIMTSGAGHVLGSSVTLASSGVGNIGTAATPLATMTQNLEINSSGSAFVSNSGTTSLQLSNSQLAGSLSVKDSSGNFSVAGTVAAGVGSANNATTNGLTLIETGKTLSVSPSAVLSATGGSVVIQDTLSNGAIAIGSNAAISTDVATSTPITTGTVTIVVGPTPAPQLNANAFGTGITVKPSGSDPGTAFAGKNPGSVIGPSSGTATLNLQGRDIIFNVANAAGSITLGSGTEITADPPVSTLMATSTPVDSHVSFGVLNASNSPSALIMPTSASLSNATAGGVATTTNVLGIASNQTSSTPIPFSVLAALTSQSQNASIANVAQNSAGTIIPSAAMLAFGVPSTTFNPASAIDLDHLVLLGDSKQTAEGIGAGSTLVAPRKDTTLQTPFGTVKVGAGAVVLVVVQANNNSVSIFDLHDNHTGDVQIDGANSAVLAPGRHVTITSMNANDFSTVNPFDSISHREMQTKQNKSFTVFTSEFSIPSAIKGLDIDAALKQSEAYSDGRLTDAMLRDAAILMQFSGSSPYKRMGSKRPPSKLAMSE